MCCFVFTGRGTSSSAVGGGICRKLLLGKRDAIHHHLLEAIPETANVLELSQTPPPLGGGV